MKYVSGLAAIAALQQGRTLRAGTMYLNSRWLYAWERNSMRWPSQYPTRVCRCGIDLCYRTWEVL